MSAESLTQPYPCDRGIPNNIIGRGWHHFAASGDRVVCTLCGAEARP